MNFLRAFNHQEFGQIRIIEHDGCTYAVGVDVARALKYAHPSKAVIDHCKGTTKLGIPSPNQHGAPVIQETNCITEGDVYRLIVKASGQGKSEDICKAAEKFERWIFDEVLPSIRKHGAYMTPETLEAAILNPDTLIRICTALKEEQAKSAALSEKIASDKPKVLFADAVDASHSSILVGDLAKLIRQNGVDIGQNRLFEWLRSNGYLIKSGSSKNMPTQRSMDMRLFEVKETTITNPDGSIRISKTTKVTGKGQQHFISIFLGDREAGQSCEDNAGGAAKASNALLQENIFAAEVRR